VKVKPLVGSNETRLFDSLTEARAWLDLQPERVSIKGRRW
jgi:hypothetical protein